MKRRNPTTRKIEQRSYYKDTGKTTPTYRMDKQKATEIKGAPTEHEGGSKPPPPPSPS